MKRLTERHDLTKKLRKLESFMDALKISIEWDGYHMKVIDTETGTIAFYRDAESGEHLPDMPYFAETKLTIPE
jgi:hypothetical protein